MCRTFQDVDNNCYYVVSRLQAFHLIAAWTATKIECINQTYQQLKRAMKANGKPGCFHLTRALSVTVDTLLFLFGKLRRRVLALRNQWNWHSNSTAAACLIFIEFYADNVKRGFFCGDRTISFKRQCDTISIKYVVMFSLTPILVVSDCALLITVVKDFCLRADVACRVSLPWRSGWCSEHA